MRIRDPCGAERIIALGFAERSVILLSAQGSGIWLYGFIQTNVKFSQILKNE